MNYPFTLARRVFLPLFLLIFAFSSSVGAQQSRPKNTTATKPTAKSLADIKDITDCPVQGIGGDPNLNRRKNIRSDKRSSTLRSIQWMKDLPNPPKTDCTGGSFDRKGLKRLGEGQKITVVAWALAARKGSKETCNCGLTAPKDTDNHIILADPNLRNPTLKPDEEESITAEFTPRTRLDHPNFTQNKLQSLIDPQWKPGQTAKKGKLLVRVSGLLMFDSEHYCRRPLPRHNDWEIHPVLKVEYCPENKVCTATGNANWKNLDNN